MFTILGCAWSLESWIWQIGSTVGSIGCTQQLNPSSKQNARLVDAFALLCFLPWECWQSTNFKLTAASTRILFSWLWLTSTMPKLWYQCNAKEMEDKGNKGTDNDDKLSCGGTFWYGLVYCCVYYVLNIFLFVRVTKKVIANLVRYYHSTILGLSRIVMTYLLCIIKRLWWKDQLSWSKRTFYKLKILTSTKMSFTNKFSWKLSKITKS